VYGPTGLIAYRENTTWYYVMSASLCRHRRHGGCAFGVKDHLNSTRVVFNTSGTAQTTYDFDAYGTLRRATVSPDIRYRFTGQEYDNNVALHNPAITKRDFAFDHNDNCRLNFRARMYDSDLGMFYATDPAGQTFAPYSYVRNNPISFVDPTGMEDEPTITYALPEVVVWGFRFGSRWSALYGSGWSGGVLGSTYGGGFSFQSGGGGGGTGSGNLTYNAVTAIPWGYDSRSEQTSWRILNTTLTAGPLVSSSTDALTVAYRDNLNFVDVPDLMDQRSASNPIAYDTWNSGRIGTTLDVLGSVLSIGQYGQFYNGRWGNWVLGDFISGNRVYYAVTKGGNQIKMGGLRLHPIALKLSPLLGSSLVMDQWLYLYIN